MPSIASDLKKPSYNDGSNQLPTNSITSSKTDVNTNTKYSIEESENNSGSFNLPGNNKPIQLDIINKSNPM